LLGFARKKPMRFMPTNLNDLIQEAAELLQRTFDPRLRIQTYPRPQLWSTKADAGQLNQLLMNLCLNSRDAMPEGGTLTLTTANVTLTPEEASTIREGRPGRFVRLRVQDTGTGIPEELHERIFEPFYTTKPVGQGTGLGLAVVFGIVQSHRGFIKCDSSVGLGTTIEVYLPMAESAPVHQPTPAQKPSPLGQGERILLADDEQMIRQLAQTVLTRLGYTLTLACDGLEAVLAVQKAPEPFHVIVLDLTMPNLSGREALQMIRQIHPRLPVILASGYSAEPTLTVDPYIRFLDKPYSPSALAKMIREIIDQA
ncbi:MAG: ATP-binding protein, partial [Gemmataceae bacterium]